MAGRGKEVCSRVLVRAWLGTFNDGGDPVASFPDIGPRAPRETGWGEAPSKGVNEEVPMNGNIVPIVAIAGGMATGIIIALVAMYFDHRKQVMRNQERMAAIEKGIAMPSDFGSGSYRHGDRSSLYRGIRLLFIGGGLALALWISVGGTVAIWGAFIAMIGLGHLVYWFLVERDQNSQGAA
jgi:hypothetical protein